MGEINEDLRRVYELYRCNLRGVVASGFDEFSAPLLLSAPKKWEGARQRVLLVGQETFGWKYDEKHSEGRDADRRVLGSIQSTANFIDSDDAVAAMMWAHERFSFAQHYPRSRRSPFWRFYRDIRAAVGDDPSGFSTSVLWTNLCRQDYAGGPLYKAPDGMRQRIFLANKNILREEIHVLKPTDVIFCTGPNYDSELSLQFPGVEFREVGEGIPQRQLASLAHSELPQLRTWRVYHPAYMNRKRSSFGLKLWQRVLELIRTSTES